VHLVEHGLVEDVAGDLLAGALAPGDAAADRLVALGGGRVVDVAKALAAARTAAGHPARALAVPTTLSGAEMSGGHRVARGAVADLRVRCAVVVNDPALSASQPVPELAASALNAFGHAAEALYVPHRIPVIDLVAAESARILGAAFSSRGEPDRDALALGALLGGYALDASGLGLHHVLAQTLVREAGVGHGPANAVMLPHTLGALAWRGPASAERLTAALDEDPAVVAARICSLTGASRLAELGVDAGVLPRCADAAAARRELDNTPPPADRAEILALYEHAY